MRLSHPRLVALGIMLPVIAAVFYATRGDLKPRAVVPKSEHEAPLAMSSLELVSSAPASQNVGNETGVVSHPRAAESFSPAFTESSSIQIEDLRKEIATIESRMLKQQIAMHSMLKSGLIADPDPEKSDAEISVPNAQDTTDETSALRAKDNANSYVEQKAVYLGQKALWKATKERLRAAELARKK